MKFSLLKKIFLHQGFLKLSLVDFLCDSYCGEPVNLKREVVERGDAVAVLLVDPQLQEVILIEQFHAGSALNNPAEAWHLGVVAGGMNPRETPLEVALRETREESGMTPSQLRLLASFYPSSGGCSEKIHLVYGEVDATTAPTFSGCAQEQEDIRVLRVPFVRAFQMLEDGDIRCGHALVALQKLWMMQATNTGK